jgi:hypothetical protein
MLSSELQKQCEKISNNVDCCVISFINDGEVHCLMHGQKSKCLLLALDLIKAIIDRLERPSRIVGLASVGLTIINWIKSEEIKNEQHAEH